MLMHKKIQTIKVKSNEFTQPKMGTQNLLNVELRKFNPDDCRSGMKIWNKVLILDFRLEIWILISDFYNNATIFTLFQKILGNYYLYI